MSITTSSIAALRSWVSSDQNASSVAFLRWSPTQSTRPRSRSETTVTYSCRFWKLVSSMPSTRIGSSARRARPRSTARFKIPSASSQLRPISRARPATVVSRSSRIAIASNRAVNRLRSSAHGTRIVRNPPPCSGHSTRGIRALNTVRYWQVSRWRQRRSGERS